MILQEEKSPRSFVEKESKEERKNQKEESIEEKRRMCKIGCCMKLLILMITTGILVAIIVPLTIKDEETGISMIINSYIVFYCLLLNDYVSKTNKLDCSFYLIRKNRHG